MEYRQNIFLVKQAKQILVLLSVTIMNSLLLILTIVLQLLKLSVSFTATAIGRIPAASYRTKVRSSCLYASALIIQNKGGGHGELGYQITKKLLHNYNDLIDSITILQDNACKDAQNPFKLYATDLPSVNKSLARRT